MIEIIAITELINAGEFDTEMIEEKIHKQEKQLQIIYTKAL